MDPQLPTSFIPKRPVVAGIAAEHPKSHAVGVLSLLTAIIVVATIASFGFVYLYSRSLTSQKEKLQQSIDDARNGVGTDFLADMERLNLRITGVKALLQRHIVVTPVFQALQKTTLRSIQYKSFTYEFTSDPATKAQMVTVKITGTAKNYATLALQSDAYAQSPIIKNPVFSNLTVDDKTSLVTFDLTFDVSPDDLSFETFIAGNNPVQTQQATPPAGTVSTLQASPTSPTVPATQ